jgi:hypothetical protein
VRQEEVRLGVVEFDGELAHLADGVLEDETAEPGQLAAGAGAGAADHVVGHRHHGLDCRRCIADATSARIRLGADEQEVIAALGTVEVVRTRRQLGDKRHAAELLPEARWVADGGAHAHHERVLPLLLFLGVHGLAQAVTQAAQEQADLGPLDGVVQVDLVEDDGPGRTEHGRPVRPSRQTEQGGELGCHQPAVQHLRGQDEHIRRLGPDCGPRGLEAFQPPGRRVPVRTEDADAVAQLGDQDTTPVGGVEVRQDVAAFGGRPGATVHRTLGQFDVVSGGVAVHNP